MKHMSAEEYRRQQVGKLARVHGLRFEEQIEASLRWYEDRGILKATKTPEPMKPLGKPDSRGRFLACYVKAAQVDFSGTAVGGRSVRFEAKQTDTDRFDRKRLTDEQMDDLRGHEALGALCFVILCFSHGTGSVDTFYRVPWKNWDDMKAIYGRQYVTEKDVASFRIPAPAGIIKILHGIEPYGSILKEGRRT